MFWILWYREGWEPETDAAWDGAPAWGCYSTGADVWPGSSIALSSLAAGGRRARHACSTQQTAGRATELRLSALLPRTDAQYPVSFTQTSKQYQNQTHSAFINIKCISTVYSRSVHPVILRVFYKTVNIRYCTMTTYCFLFAYLRLYSLHSLLTPDPSLFTPILSNNF